MDEDTDRDLDTERATPAPPGDSLAQDRMFARVAASMFGTQASAPRIGGYYVLESIGRGGMGTVYAAYDADLDRRVAIKLLHGHDESDETAKARLLREARALAKLTHPNVVTVHAVGTSERGVYLAMEYIEGRTLAGFIAEEPSLDALLDVFVGAARGLAAAHAVGLVHRDFKPHNVLLGSDDVPRVADFGLARPVEAGTIQELPLPLNVPTQDEQTPLTRTGGVVGTPAYMAPEQHAVSDVGPAADQFAFCVSLFEAVFGRLPFEGRTVAAMATAKMSGELVFPARRDVPRWLQRMLERGLAPDPEARWSDMAALIAEVERGRRGSRRWWVPSLGVAALGLWGAAWATREPSPEPVDPCDPVQSSMHTVWNDARAEELTIAPKLRERVDAYAQAWIELDARTCHDHALGRVSARTLEARNFCLQRLRDALDYDLGLLERGDASIVERAAPLLNALRSVQSCDFDAAKVPLQEQADDPADLEVGARVRDQIAHAYALGQVGKHEEAKAIAQALWAEREEVVDPWSRAELQRLAALRVLEGDEKEAALRGALDDAIRSGHYQLQAFTYLDLADLVHRRERRKEGWTLLSSAEAAVDAFDAYSKDDPGIRHWAELLRGRVDNLRGVFAKREGKPASLTWFEQALEHWSKNGDRDPDRVLMAEHNVGEGLRDHGRVLEALPHYESSLELALELFSGAHPYPLQIRTNLAAVQIMAGMLEPALANLDTALQDVGGRTIPIAAELHFHRATVLTATGDYDGARVEFDQAEAIWKGKPHTEKFADLAVVGRAGVIRRLGRPKDAQAEAAPAVARLLEVLGAEHPEVVRPRLELAVILATLGDEAALTEAQQAKQALEDSLGLGGPAGAEAWRAVAFARARTGGSLEVSAVEYDRAVALLADLRPDHYLLQEIQSERAMLEPKGGEFR